ncbi:Glycosyl transferase, family 43 [Dillenia turbinata]|uniref:Glycosyltransferases n=1 Tax=Dillenia turbinata TaxID=194707 RepID=A0AAN8VYQ0_9MAGN
MGSLDRSKKRVHLCKKAVVHFLLCFIMGFFTGFAPTSKSSSAFSNHPFSSSNQSDFLRDSIQEENANRSSVADTPEGVPKSNDLGRAKFLEETELIPRRLVIIITPTIAKDRFRSVLLRRLGNTLKLVSQPLLWIVLESKSDSEEVSEILRKTGVMYRHLVYKENFTDTNEELDHQRNVALSHIEHHRLSGIVHFAGLYNVYDLAFFDELREIEVFGTWPMALLSANKRRVVIEGPVCDSSEVIGWHLRRKNNQTDSDSRPQIHISTFAFNSSILWDPERWGRLSSVQLNSQNSLRFVKQVVHEDEAQLKGLPREDCSKIMLWHLNIPNEATAHRIIVVPSGNRPR